jgi:hypothetical protein
MMMVLLHSEIGHVVRYPWLATDYVSTVNLSAKRGGTDRKSERTLLPLFKLRPQTFAPPYFIILVYVRLPAF